LRARRRGYGLKQPAIRQRLRSSVLLKVQSQLDALRDPRLAQCRNLHPLIDFPPLLLMTLPHGAGCGNQSQGTLCDFIGTIHWYLHLCSLFVPYRNESVKRMGSELINAEKHG
jgi:hypothetical protein